MFGFEADIIYHLQKLSSVFFDYLNLGITLIGDEIFFIAVAVFLYWCIDKRFAFEFANVYFFSVGVNEGLKALIRRPRPYAAYEGKIRSIGEKTGGWSFPSGHSQSIACIGTQTSRKYKKKVFIIVSSVLTVLVMFSRIYLGQHYLTDTLVGAALGVGLAFSGKFLFSLLGDKEERLALVVAPAALILAVVLCAVGMGGATANVLKVAGAYCAFSAGYCIEKRFVRFNVRAVWWKQLIKFAVGIGVVFAIKELLKLAIPENLWFLSAFVRYFAVGAWVSLGAPALFKAVGLYVAEQAL